MRFHEISGSDDLVSCFFSRVLSWDLSEGRSMGIPRIHEILVVRDGTNEILSKTLLLTCLNWKIIRYPPKTGLPKSWTWNSKDPKVVVFPLVHSLGFTTLFTRVNGQQKRRAGRVFLG